MDPVRAYHERSKHHLDRYAPGPGGLDWATQPDPFRRYAGAPELTLQLLDADLPVSWDDLCAAAVPPQALNADNIAILLQLSLGLSAWKSYGGNRWALRCN
ncbi:MAG: nitroreductase, partial [Rhodocyclaceae bacterium]|nr:nitroreductase [Rhodocyclaceae bacterium]